MKISKIQQVIFIILLITMILTLTNISLATTVVGGTSISKIEEDLNSGGVYLDYNSITHNPHVFCRQHDKVFPRGKAFAYVTDGSSISYQRNAWAYLFAYNAHGKAASLQELPLQNAFWTALGNSITAFNTSNPNWTSSGNTLLQKAEQYQKVNNLISSETINKIQIQTQKQYNNNNVYKITTGDATLDQEISGNSDNIVDLGAGITEFAIVDPNTNNYLEYRLYYIKDDKNVYFLDENGGNYCSKITSSQNNNKIRKLMHQLQFFIEIKDKNILTYEIQVKLKYMDPEVTFIPITSKSNQTYTGAYICNEHQATYTNVQNLTNASTKTNANTIYTYSIAGQNFKLTYSSSSTKCWSNLPSYNKTCEVNPSNYIYIYNIKNNQTKCTNCGAINSFTVARGMMNYCYSCDFSAKNNLVYGSTYDKITYHYFTCGGYCGTTNYPYTANNIQKLIIIKAEKNEGTKLLSGTGRTGFAVNLNIEKYANNKIVRGKALEQFEFKIEAYQEQENIYSKTINLKQNSSIILNTLNINPVYIKITETSAPEMYNILSKPILCKFTYDNSNQKFKLENISPTEEDAGISNDNISWSKNGNTYTLNNERYILDINNKKIQIYDTMEPIKLSMKKYNSFFASKKIEFTDNVQFEVQAIQWDDESSKNKNLIINGNPGPISIGVNSDINIVPINNKVAIWIVIREITAPNGYNLMNKAINLKLVPTPYQTDKESPRYWGTTFVDQTNTWNEIFGQGTNGNWEYQGELDDKDSNNEPDKSFPNPYKSEDNDWIIAKYDNGRTIIEVFDEADIKINLEKFSADGNIDLSNQVTFNMVAKQQGNTLVDTNLTGELNYAINAQNTNSPVYILITEIEKPDGYIQLSKSLNIKYIYNIESKSWDATLCPTESDWTNNSGFEKSTYGGWNCESTEMIDGKNVYTYVSTGEDIIKMKMNENAEAVVTIYNEKIAYIDKISLLKIDMDTKEILKGAKFSGEITNVNSFSINGQLINKDYNPYNAFLSLSNNKISFEKFVLSEGSINLEELELIDSNNNVDIILQEIVAPDEYKVLNQPITISLHYDKTTKSLSLNNLVNLDNSYIEIAELEEQEGSINIVTIKVPNKKIISLSGKVWLDGQTGIKPSVSSNGKYDNGEKIVSEVKVSLWNGNKQITSDINNKLFSEDGYIYTDTDGKYEFNKVEYGPNYSIKFEYDGINYIATNAGKDSSAQEPTTTDMNSNIFTRADFNRRYNIINKDLEIEIHKGKKNIKEKLEYESSPDKTESILKTLSETNSAGKWYPYMYKNANNKEYLSMGKVQEKFKMISTTMETYKDTKSNINFGLVKRGTDAALSLDVDHTEVSINGNTTKYVYPGANNEFKLEYNDKTDSYNDKGITSNKTRNNQGIYKSDYDYTGSNPLNVKVTYRLKLQNQSNGAININKVKLIYDNNYAFSSAKLGDKSLSIDNNILPTECELAAGTSQIVYIEFDVNKQDGKIPIGDFEVKAEIEEYATDEGFIDWDSAPGNLGTDNFEDDSDKAKVTISLKTTETGEPDVRKISGTVFEDINKNGILEDRDKKVNDVIVQLIEVKTIDGNNYEYIWQETRSGHNQVKTTNKTYTNSVIEGTDTGKYEFADFIPGNYIIRFIYGDGKTYDISKEAYKNSADNVKTYNGQDYKSTIDKKYHEEWYNTAGYETNSSIARDNEARRLKTMAWSTKVDGEKGILLKLLDVQDVDELNETEKELIIEVYNKFYDPDINKVDTVVLNKLLTDKTLANTFMQAETSKIKVAVDTENLSNTDNYTIVQRTVEKTIVVNGKKQKIIGDNAIKDITNINFGLQERPKTSIELKKYITGFKLVASNGQTLVNAKADVNSYFNRIPAYDQIKGIKNNLQVMDTYWEYAVDPTKVNTVVEGSTLEFEYTVVVENKSEEDYLSSILMSAYEGNDYEKSLKEFSEYASGEKKLPGKETYSLGKYLGQRYYTGEKYNPKKESPVKLEVTEIRDYIDNNLVFASTTITDKVRQVTLANNKKFNVLNTNYSLKKINLNNVLEVVNSTGKMPIGTKTMYAVSLKPTHVISTSGTKDFYNYIAEVMEYTNAAGRRADSTPANAEIIDHEYRKIEDEDGNIKELTHEKDEADTGRIQIGVATGEDEKTPQILAVTIIISSLIVGLGLVTIKRYVLR